MLRSMDHSKEFMQLVADIMPRVREITIDELQALPKPYRLVHVREESEFAAGHLVGAEHISKGVMERDIVKKVPNKDEQVVLYCGGGYRSALAADNIQKMGYRNVLSLRGGFTACKERGLPTTKP
jgi:rhodanese-related sulfurtransferase